MLIAKYLPTTGWYRKLDGMDQRLDGFLERHRHEGESNAMYGYHITTVREVEPDVPNN